MKFALVALVALTFAACANAECANACSGHGTCGSNDECACFPNWMAADCSERVCPYGLSFVDSPAGDLNHNAQRDTSDENVGLVKTMRSNQFEWETYPVQETAYNTLTEPVATVTIGPFSNDVQTDVDAKHVILTSGSDVNVFWFDINNDGSATEPVIAGATDYTEITTVVDDDADTVTATALQVAIAGHANYDATVNGAVVTIQFAVSASASTGISSNDGTHLAVTHTPSSFFVRYGGAPNQAVFAQTGEAHYYSECSNKGLCDRELGVCQCFAGYTGSSCQRTSCPNDCSGHGVCRTVAEVAANAMNYKETDNVGGEVFFTGVTANPRHPNGNQDYNANGFSPDSLLYRLWDGDKAQTCVCDAGYSGPDCSRRECPRGNDPLTHRSADCGGATCAAEVQEFTFVGAADGADWVDWVYVSWTEWTGEIWRTDTFQFGTNIERGCVGEADARVGPGLYATEAAAESAIATAIEKQLHAVPNAVLAGTSVSVDLTHQTGGDGLFEDITVTVTFPKGAGNVNDLVWTQISQNDASFPTHPNCGHNRIMVFENDENIDGTHAAADLGYQVADGGVYSSGVDQPITIGVAHFDHVDNDPPTIGSVVGLAFTAPAEDLENAAGQYIVTSLSRDVGNGIDILTINKAIGVHDAITADGGSSPDSGGTLYGMPSTVAAGSSGTAVLTAPTPPATHATTDGNEESSTCSNRGLCDYETGLCKCFRGYYKGDCSSQNALAGAFTAAA